MSNLKKIRKRLGISQSVVAVSVGVSQGAIGHYENGRRTPDIEMCWKIVSTLNSLGAKCTVDDVFPGPQLDNTQNRKTA